MPDLSLTEMIDLRLQVAQTIERMEAEKSNLGEQIVKAMQKNGVKQAFGTEAGYRLQEKLECTYNDDAYGYAKRNGLEPIFTPPPKITRAKVMEANKKNLLTLAQFKRLQKGAGPLQTAYSLVSIPKPEEKEPDNDV